MSKVTCSLPQDKLAARRAQLERELRPRITATRVLPDGVAFQLPASEHDAAQAFIDYERGCCSFASFAISPDSTDADRIWVEIRSASNTAEIKRLFGR